MVAGNSQINYIFTWFETSAAPFPKLTVRTTSLALELPSVQASRALGAGGCQQTR